MPFKSQAQRRKFAQLLVEGKIFESDLWRMESRNRREAAAWACRRKGQRPLGEDPEADPGERPEIKTQDRPV